MVKKNICFVVSGSGMLLDILWPVVGVLKVNYVCFF